MDFCDVTACQESLGALGIAGNDCAVYRENECVYRHWTGMADLEKRLPMGDDTVYRFYSMTKPVTCAAALMLAEQGKLRLEDPVAEFLPEYANLHLRGENGAQTRARKTMRVLDLFRMTSGIDYNLASPSLEALAREKPDYTTRDFARALAAEPLAFEPGEGWLYGLGHDVLAAVIETVSGLAFGPLLRQSVFEPLGIKEMWFRPPQGAASRMARTYAPGTDAARPQPLPRENRYQRGLHESGGAGLCGTLDDYARFARALCAGGGGLLMPRTVASMRRDWLESDAQHVDFHRFKPCAHGYGLGVYAPSRGEDGPFGWGGAAGTFLLADPSNRLTVLIAYQSMPNLSNDVRPALVNAIYQALGLRKPLYMI